MENKTLVIYDLNGTVIQQVTGLYEVPIGLPFIEIEIPKGKYVLYIDVNKKEPVYSDIPKSEIEILQHKISILEAENEKLKLEQEQQNEEILVNMLANTEMFEMILGMIPMTLSKDKTKNNGGNRGICDIYASLIEKGVKTINDVPVQIVEQVKNKLEL